MKSFFAIIFTISAVTARGSGPYLPSGWRPTGPAFYLPSEVTTPADSPLKQTLVETEASGSDSLREYGPPKIESAVQVEIKEEVQQTNTNEASQDLTNQALPDVATELAFYAEGRNIGEVNAEVEEIKQEEEVVAVQEVNSEQLTASDDTTTESVVEVINEPELEPTVAAKSIAVDEIVETTDKIETNSEINESQDIVEVTAVVESATEIVEKLEENVEGSGVDESAAIVENAAVEGAAVEEVAKEVSNIAETIEKLEQEVVAEVKAVQEITETNTAQEVSGSVAKVPEGFLEYGPPGFQEYGPPKQDVSAAVVIPDIVAIEENEVRRRRFSPKFRSLKKH